MNVITQNEHYIIWSNYETAYLTIKNANRVISIGDFYGDPMCAIIDVNNRYCVVGGCGIIVYYLKEPYLSYRYNYITKQWAEAYRNGDNWIESINQVDHDSVLITFDTGKSEVITIENM